MTKIETTEKYAARSEEEAKNYLEQVRHDAAAEGYILKKSGYEYKTKKAKHEIIDEVWLCSCTKVFNDIWEI